MSTPTSSVQISNPPSYPSLSPTYSHISIIPLSSTKRLISFAGQTGTSLDHEANSKLSLADQGRIALQKIDNLLAHVGATKKDIVMVRPYVVGLADLSQEEMQSRADVYMEWWRSTEGDRLTPPDTLIGVHSLWSKETLIEYEMQVVADNM